jgi:AraC-like DNA-binding protein
MAVKAKGEHYHSLCKKFALEDLRSDLVNQREGRAHVCHAGLVEWVVPVFDKKELRWIIFAGPRLPGKSLVTITRVPLSNWQRSPWSEDMPLPDPVQEEESQLILEHLRQLASRLQLWFDSLKLANPSQSGREDTYFKNTIAVRETMIRLFIEDNYAKHGSLVLLAERLCLSQSRASHVVRKTCGASFRELLIQKRLRVAAELLRRSGLSVLEVALASGFEDIAHFHRLFKKRLGTTPAQYRSHAHT